MNEMLKIADEAGISMRRFSDAVRLAISEALWISIRRNVYDPITNIEEEFAREFHSQIVDGIHCLHLQYGFEYGGTGI